MKTMNRLIQLPPILRKGLALRMLGAAVFFIFTIVCCIGEMGLFVILSGGLPALFWIGCSATHYFACRDCLFVDGCCVEAKHSLMKRRVKTVLVDTLDGELLIHRTGFRRNTLIGKCLRVYIKSTTPIYDHDGTLLLLDPIAIEVL